jgi:hypothetical protein
MEEQDISEEKTDEFDVVVEPDSDLRLWVNTRIIIPVKTYQRLMSFGSMRIKVGSNKFINFIWSDAFLLYSHLFFTARLQGTNAVWANRRYIQNALHWGSEKVYRVLKVLEYLKLIEIKKQDKKRTSDRKYGKSYIVVKYIPTLPVNSTKSSTVKKDSDNNRCLHGVYSTESAKCFINKENVRKRVVRLFSKFKIPETDQEKHLNSHEEEYILQQLVYMENTNEKRPIKDPPAYLQCALMYDYAIRKKSSSENINNWVVLSEEEIRELKDKIQRDEQVRRKAEEKEAKKDRTDNIEEQQKRLDKLKKTVGIPGGGSTVKNDQKEPLPA